MFSFVGDVVLDPFWGTGSTTAAAIDTHRSSIGYEIEPRFIQIGMRRFQQASLDARVEFVAPGVSEHAPSRPYRAARILVT
jgi:site-specific DNA-methyltransferase (adenine-specific)